MSLRLSIGALLVTTPCLAQSPEDMQAGELPRWAAPALERATLVCDGRTGAALSFAEMLDALATADAVFLGETHIDETTHRVELAVYEGLVARRQGKVVLAMEMFQRDAQAALDAYLSGASTEEQFLAHAKPWSNYRTAYRPLIELAREQGLPVVASNFPRALQQAFSAGGLDAEQLGLVPRELHANSPAYWQRVDNAVRGHIGMMGIDPDDTERLESTQSLWDNSMGEACALALDDHPGSSVLHVNGGFHSAYWDGTVRQLALRKPDAKVLTVSVVPSSNPGVATPSGAPVADYVVYAEARATDLNEGTYTVSVQRDVDYRLHVPSGASEEHPVPLLIWFGDDGLTAQDGMALWKDRFGDDCAIAVLEPPYRELQADLVEAGRWFWPDSFAEDLGAMGVATDRLWGYLMRHVPIDPARVCIAGEGTGATVVAAVSLFDDRMGAGAVAAAPRRYSKLKDLPLPLPEFRGDEPWPDKSLRMLLPDRGRSWWEGELAEYVSIGLESELVATTEDPWLRELELENALRTSLGLAPLEPASDAPRRHIVAAGPRARYWARLLAAETAAQAGALVAVVEQPPSATDSVAIELETRPEDFAAAGKLPRCPGPFGGTTILVLPDSTPPEVAEAWLALEENDPLQATSRFHRLRIATVDGERALPTVLNGLADKGRKNVLVIPATFCADGDLMRALQKSARPFEDRMTLRWRPGLGG